MTFTLELYTEIMSAYLSVRYIHPGCDTLIYMQLF